MSDNSHIEWTDASWNPIRTRIGEKVGWGCQRVSPGCQNCYAATINHRLGTGLDYDAKGIAAAEFFLDEKTLVKPLSWRKPRKVFVCSMTDLFGEWVPDEWIDRMFAIMAQTPQHTYQLLTKRPERMRSYMTLPGRGDLQINRMGRVAQYISSPHVARNLDWPLPNVWLGVSVEDQQRADERIPVLLETPAAVRFLSCEPLLGPVDLGRNMYVGRFFDLGTPDISWVIIGGESGPGARPMDVAWARSLVSQCQSAAVACFVKQLGAKPYEMPLLYDLNYSRPMKLADRKGGDMGEWPEDLRVREFPI